MRKRKNPPSSLPGLRAAFTLAELIVVVTILAVLATVGFVSLSGHLSSAGDSSRLAEVGLVSRAVELSAVRDGKYPAPVAAEGTALVSFTGGASWGAIVTQWAATAANVRDLGGSFGKAKRTGPFAYSVLGDGAAYQVAAEMEGGVSRSGPGVPGGVPEAYALSKTAYVEGNYRADPSLPSLIVSSGSVSGAWLFSSDACFVTNGGGNLFSTAAGCVPKKSLALKSLDSALVGYWDMETACSWGSCGVGNDGKLADLSGNGGHATASGGTMPLVTNGAMGKAYAFSNANKGNAFLVDSPLLNTGDHAEITLEAIGLRNDNNVYQGLVTKINYSYTWAKLMATTPLKLDTDYDGKMRGVVTEWQTWTTATIIEWAIAAEKAASTSTGTFYHYAVTSSNGTTKLYINGRLAASEKSTGSMWGYRGIDSYFMIGRAAWVGGNPYYAPGFWACDGVASSQGSNACFDGKIDEVKFYYRALSDEEILQRAISAWVR